MSEATATAAAPAALALDTAGALHDFNNALQAMDSGLRLLERMATQGDATKAAAMIAAIKDQVARLGSLGNALVRTTGGPMTADHPPIAIAPFVHAITPQVAALLDGHIRLDVSVEAEAGIVACDPARLESAIRNLVLNARDAMQDGGALTLRARAVEIGQTLEWVDAKLPPGRFAAITIGDTGAGMSADLLRYCFEPFVTTKKAQGGSGLGLFQLRAFAQEAGGTVRLRSEVGQGTEATILLPCGAPPPR